MSIRKNLTIGILISYLGRLTQIASNVIFLPILFRKLGSNEIGFWFFISQAGMFVGLLDFGFTPTLSRRISFATQNANNTFVSEDKRILHLPLETIVYTGVRLFRYLAILVFIVSIVTGLWLLSSVPGSQGLKMEVYISWILLCVGYATNTWAGAWSCILGGMGEIGQQGLIATGFQLFGWVSKILVVVFGGGIVLLAATEIGVGILGRFIFVSYIRRKHPKLLIKNGNFSMPLIISMLKPAILTWVTSLAAYLIYRTDQYFIILRLGVTQIPNYQAAATVIDNLLTMAMIIGLSATPFYSILWRKGEYLKFNTLLYCNAKSSLAITLVGGMCVLVLSPYLFNLWLGEGHFVGLTIIGIFIVRTFIQCIHWSLSQAIRSTEYEFFVVPAIFSAILNLVLTYYLSSLFGLLGIALGTAIAEIATVFWYTFHLAHKRLNVNFRDYWQNVGLPTLGLAIISSGIYAIATIPDYSSFNLMVRIFAVVLICTILAFYLWRFALPEEIKKHVNKFVSSSIFSFQTSKKIQC